MKFDKAAAMKLLREEATGALGEDVDPAWMAKSEKLSQLCEDGVSKTHIAFYITSALAKSLNRRVDLFAIKPSHAKDNENAYSARTLCHSVIVPLAAELGINLGVTGREPLNNQPYFRMTRLQDETPVHGGGRAAFDYMIELVEELSELPTESAARSALRAFIAVRRRFQPRYTSHIGAISVRPENFAESISAFVRQGSERGRRAQAVVAGLFDVVAGTGRVESGRINDPSRKYPGDVCVRMADDAEKWEKAVEVRDKPVSASDIQIFAKKCIDMGVREAAVVMVSEMQVRLDGRALSSWASEFGIGLTLFHGWPSFVDQVLFWAEPPKPEAAVLAVECVEERLIAVEASSAAVTAWQKLFRPDVGESGT